MNEDYQRWVSMAVRSNSSKKIEMIADVRKTRIELNIVRPCYVFSMQQIVKLRHDLFIFDYKRP